MHQFITSLGLAIKNWNGRKRWQGDGGSRRPVSAAHSNFLPEFRHPLGVLWGLLTPVAHEICLMRGCRLAPIVGWALTRHVCSALGKKPRQISRNQSRCPPNKSLGMLDKCLAKIFHLGGIPNERKEFCGGQH
jgi:hypothetical protein